MRELCANWLYAVVKLEENRNAIVFKPSVIFFRTENACVCQ